MEFWKDNVEYDYEIDAYTGTILHSDRDIEGYSIPAQSSADIGADRAKEIALDHAGVSASKATFVRAHLDYEDGRRVYDVEFYSGSKEYDYEIDAASGDILSWDYDAEYYTGQAAGQTGSYLSEAEVRQIVEDRAGVSGTFRELHLDRDDELRGVAAGRSGLVVLVLEQTAAQRELPEELRHHLPLFLRGRELFMPYRHVLGALSGGHVADVVVQMGGGALRAALEVGALEYDAGHRHSLPSIIKK